MILATKERRIFSELKTDVEAIVLKNATDPNLDQSFFYATGITNGLFEDSVAIIRPRGVEVLTSTLEELSARESGVKTTVYMTRKEAAAMLSKKLRGMKRIGINSAELTHANYVSIRKCAKGARLVDVSQSIAAARMKKDADELGRIKRACEIASRTADLIPEFVKAGMLETEAAAEINYRMMGMGASGPSFPTNASFGPATAEPHYSPGAMRLKKGQLALFDFGAMYRRYVSDLTRTFVCGRPSAAQKELYDVVLRAQIASIEAIHDGVHGKEVDMAGRRIIDSSRFKGKFTHGTGHGLGISVHDPGSISSQRDMVLREGMVLTVEPGAYVKDFGGVRIEDDILVTKKGCKILTSTSRDLISL
jgi:Xaa-Pro dipeptidase